MAVVEEILDNGTSHYRRLTERQVTLQERKPGAYDCYLAVTLFCGRKYRTRLDTTAADDRRGLNRSERLRQFPPGTPEYDWMYPWRPDIESGNNTLDQTHYRNRIIADKIVDQTLIVTAWGLVRNILSAAAFRGRASEVPGAAEAA